jgi:hypothetical protein
MHRLGFEENTINELTALQGNETHKKVSYPISRPAMISEHMDFANTQIALFKIILKVAFRIANKTIAAHSKYVRN